MIKNHTEKLQARTALQIHQDVDSLTSFLKMKHVLVPLLCSPITGLIRASQVGTTTFRTRTFREKMKTDFSHTRHLVQNLN